MIPTAIYPLAGLILIGAGRRLFWLFVGILGFVYGAQYGSFLPGLSSEPGALAAGLTVGIAGALIALLFYRLAVMVSGFLAGGYVALQVLGAWTGEAASWFWIPFAVCGIVGAFLANFILDWALIVLSSILGATLILQIFTMSASLYAGLFLGLSAAGIIIQGKTVPKK